MIRFKCIYCGQKIVARDDGAGKKGKCPKCGHDLVVPWSTKGRPAISSDEEPIPDSEWKKEPRFAPEEEEDARIELCKESFGFLIPAYDELSLFLMAAIWILLFATNGRMREQICFFLAKTSSPKTFIFVIIFLGALGLCLYQVFTTREKTDFEKKVMAGFGVLTNILTGVIAGVYVLKDAAVSNWQLIFPIWNIINAFLLYLMVGAGFIDEDCISDRDATIAEVILGLTAVLVIFIFCNYVFKLHWAVTFSICIIYAVSFDKAVQKVLPGLTNGEDE